MMHTVLSDDESDHKNGTNLGRSRYVIVQEEWRSDELIKWLRTIDLLACGEKWDGCNVARQGNGRRLRVVSTRSKGGVAVLGLRLYHLDLEDKIKVESYAVICDCGGL
jgi:hypothetical protein